MMRGEWLGTVALIAVIAAIAGGGLWYWGGGDGSRPAGNKEEVVARLAEDCLQSLQRRRAIREHNTEAQIRGACNCVSEELYAHTDGQKEEMTGESHALDGSMEPAIMKCIQRAGLSVSE